MTKTPHTLSNDRFREAMLRRGWTLDPNGSGVWNGPPGLTRLMMEKSFKDALVESICCPHEEAGCDDSPH